MNRYKFRLTSKAMASECAVILIGIPSLLLVPVFIILLYRLFDVYELSSSDPLFSILLISCSAIVAFPSLGMIFTPILRVLFSHLSLSRDGLDFRFWPLHRIRCTWQDVDQIKKSSLPFQGDILILKRAEVTGFHLLANIRQGKFGFTKTQPSIPLFRLKGWLDGELESKLREYAPGLFVNRATENI